MGKIVDKTETKIVTLDGVEIIKQVTKVLMPMVSTDILLCILRLTMMSRL